MLYRKNEICEVYSNTKKNIEKGVSFWSRFIDAVDWNVADFIIVLSGDKEIDEAIEALYQRVIEYYLVNRLFIMCVGGIKVQDGRKRIIPITNDDYEAFATLFRLYNFSNRVIFADTTYVAQSNPKRLIGCCGINIKDIAKCAVLGLRDNNQIKEILLEREEINLSRLDYQLEGFDKGFSIYKEIRDKYAEELLCYNNRASGNTYILSRYLPGYVEENKFDYVVLNDSLGNQHICELFNIKSQFLEKQKGILLKKYCDTASVDATFFRTMDPYNTRTNMICMRGYKGLDFKTIYERVLYENENTVEFYDNHFRGFPIKDISEKRAVPKDNKTVLLSPYSNTICPLPKQTWLNLIDKLKESGFSVVINTKENDEKFAGEEKIFLPYDEMISYVDECIAFIGTRSGLCDIVSQTKTNMIVLYPGISEANNNESLFNYFSIKKMGLREDGTIELKLEDDEIPIDIILNYLLEIKNPRERTTIG